MSTTAETFEARYKKLLKILDLHKKHLAAADSPQELVEMYALVLSHLGRLSATDLSRTGAVRRTSAPSPSITPDEIAAMSLDRIEQITANPDTPRRTLEEIAVVRFNVPRGSLRSFSNLKMLRDKISTRIQNERTHETISSVARRSESSSRG